MLGMAGNGNGKGIKRKKEKEQEMENNKNHLNQFQSATRWGDVNVMSGSGESWLWSNCKKTFPLLGNARA